MTTLQYRLILTPEPEGGYTVKVPAIRGCVTYEETIEEAIAMAQDAIEGYLDVLKEESQPIPPDDSQKLVSWQAEIIQNRFPPSFFLKVPYYPA